MLKRYLTIARISINKNPVIHSGFKQKCTLQFCLQIYFICILITGVMTPASFYIILSQYSKYRTPLQCPLSELRWSIAVTKIKMIKDVGCFIILIKKPWQFCVAIPTLLLYVIHSLHALGY